MAIEPVEPNQSRAGLYGHVEAVADRGSGVTRQHPIGPRADIGSEEFGISRKTAIGDDNRIGANAQHRAVPLRRDADDGKEPINGWAISPRIEELRAAWLDTADFEEQKQICADLQKQMWTGVPFIPMGEYWQASAYRRDLTEVLPGCFAVFYGVRRA